MNGMNYMVVWSIQFGTGGGLFELDTDYQPFENIDEARAFYDSLEKNPALYSRSLTAVIDSTDYDTHPELRLYSRG